MKNFKVSQKGFTIVEMIVVFTVIAVLSTISIAAFVSYNRSQVLQIGADEVSQALVLARSRSVSQTKPDQCSSQVLDGYKVILNISDSSYRVIAVCSDTFEYQIGNTSYLPKNVTFSQQTTSTSFFFPIIVSGVQGQGTIYLTAYGKNKTISVTSTGISQ